MVLVLREGDVKSLITMPEVVSWVEDTFRAYGLGRARIVPRQRVKFPRGWLHVLPGGDMEQGAMGVKSYTSYREGIRPILLLYSGENGGLQALIEAGYLGMIRTGAASGVATRYMARSDADTLAIFGTGYQAKGQLEAVATVRQLKQVRAFGRDPERRKRFAEEMSKVAGVEVVPSETPAEALKNATIVVTATTSRNPVFPADAAQAGVHINAMGSNSLLRKELEDDLFRRAANVVVDSRETARQESGDLLGPVERGWIEWDQLPELSDVVVGRVPGRRADADITIFESQGIGLQDVAVAAHLYRRARQQGVGEELKICGA